MIEAALDPESLRKIMEMAKQASKIIKTEVYNGIKEAAKPAADAAKESVMSAPTTGGRTWRPMRSYSKKSGYMIRNKPRSKGEMHGSGLRSGIAAGVTVGLGAGANTQGVRITSSNKGLREDQYRMNRTYNNDTFRHPVFGQGSVVQTGKEWFFKPIAEKRPEFEESIARAMEQAAERLSRL